MADAVNVVSASDFRLTWEVEQGTSPESAIPTLYSCAFTITDRISIVAASVLVLLIVPAV